MKFTPEKYYYASGTRLKEAEEAHNTLRSYTLAMYWSGVAVECMLRAFRMRIDPQFDSRHDLKELLLASRLALLDSQFLARRTGRTRESQQHSYTIKSHVNTVYVLWRNSLRYEDHKTVENKLRRLTDFSRLRGDVLKEASRQLLESASSIIERGTLLW